MQQICSFQTFFSLRHLSFILTFIIINFKLVLHHSLHQNKLFLLFFPPILVFLFLLSPSTSGQLSFSWLLLVLLLVKTLLNFPAKHSLDSCQYILAISRLHCTSGQNQSAVSTTCYPPLSFILNFKYICTRAFQLGCQPFLNLRSLSILTVNSINTGSSRHLVNQCNAGRR